MNVKLMLHLTPCVANPTYARSEMRVGADGMMNLFLGRGDEVSDIDIHAVSIVALCGSGEEFVYELCFYDEEMRVVESWCYFTLEEPLARANCTVGFACRDYNLIAKFRAYAEDVENL